MSLTLEPEGVIEFFVCCVVSRVMKLKQIHFLSFLRNYEWNFELKVLCENITSMR